MALPFITQFITRNAVLKMLIHYRCKEAERVQRVLVVENLAVKSCTDTAENPANTNSELKSLFPPRRQWVHISYEKRWQLSQLDKNEKNLLYTVMREAKRDGEHPTWYERLNDRVDQIVKAALTSKKLFNRPSVSVIEKKRNDLDKTIECRPICQFKTLDERIYASLYNKVYTHLFDSFFYEKSFAFRVPKKGDQMLHLKAIQRIKAFRKAHQGKVWVAECDMKKFYDTLDHDVIKKRFSQMLLWSKHKGLINIMEARILKQVVFSYVNCFRFYHDVYRYNAKQNHHIWRNLKNTKDYKKGIKWILGDIERRRKYEKWPYRTRRHERNEIGVPQGGALSGIIANVMMHFTDMKLRHYWTGDDNFLYIRFCDDMIMMGVNKNKIEDAFERYRTCIENDHLYMHPPVAFKEKYMKAFWDGKTRPPYVWGSPAKNVMPWITFVGYDVNWEGDTRIRRSSLRKEIKKQYEKKTEIIHLLNKHGGRKPQWSKQYICNSVHKRMIGMSVGRVQIWNYKVFGNYFSWAKAFTELTDNPWSRAQLRLLDYHRNRMMKQLSKFTLDLNYQEIKPSDKREHSEAVWYYGKPFSYYGQVLKKW